MLMKRWRFLSVLLSCFAVLAAGMPAIAVADASSKLTPSGYNVDSVRTCCSTCRAPCARANIECAERCVNSGPTVPTLSMGVKALAATKPDQTLPSILRGLSPRPDLFPPCA